LSNYAITVDTGGSSRRWSDTNLLSFYRNTGIMQSALENMKGSVRGLRSGFQGATRCLSQMGFAVRGVLSGLMDTRNVVDGLRSGMKNLYAYSRTWWKGFAGTLQSLSANANYLRNSLAAMAAPLLTALSPAIEYVTDQFVGLFNLINQFFARLTGASTYVAAKRAAGGVSSVGRAASNASDAVKELKRQLADFDELNVLEAPDTGSGSGGGSGGGGGGGAGVQFEELPIESGLAAFVDALKAAFNAGDWQELGTLIGGKINELVESVDWAAIGAKVGYYVNGLFSTAYWTLETVNFTNIGASVAEFLNNALAEIDFTTVGGAVALLFTSLAETIAGFIDEFDWMQFAEKLADGVNGFAAKLGEKLDAVDWAGLALRLTEGLNAFIAGTDWPGVGATFAGRVNDLLAVLGTASASFDWKGASEALAASVNNLFRKIDWEGLGTWLNDTLLGVLDFGLAFFEGFDAKGFADGLERALAKVDWDAISEKLWALFRTALEKLGEVAGALLFGGGADLKLNLSLLKDGWETLAKWLGIDRPLSALVALVRNNWQTIARWLGIESPLSALVSLVKSGWSSIGGFVGQSVSVSTSLTKSGWTSISDFVGTAVSVATSLTKSGWSSISDYVGTSVEVKTKLEKKGWSSISSFVGSSVSVGVKAKLEKKSEQALRSAATKAMKGIQVTVKAKSSSGGAKMVTQQTGGVIANGWFHRFGVGGVISGGVARYLSGVPHYAGGTTRAHGTVFVAGEAGPEVMGHINGRTEILNKSQLAQTMYSAVLSAMGQAVSALGTFLSGQLANCTNAIVGTLGRLSGVANIQVHEPVMATGTVLPYDVAAQIERTGADIQNTLDANNEDLIQTIISVIGAQTSAIVSALRTNQQQGAANNGLTARQVIDDINRRAQMFGSSPILN